MSARIIASPIRPVCLSVLRYHTLLRRQLLARAPEEVFAFFSDAGNLQAITPPSLDFRIVTPRPIEMRAGAVVEYRLGLRRLPLVWLTGIDAWEPARRFVDVQIAGPYALWHHTHEFEPVAGGTLMRDVVRYALPLWPAGEVVLPLVRRELDAIFDFRRAEVARRFGGS